jgi:thymidylate synthase ThyX
MTTHTPPDSARDKTGIPKNPGRRDLGLRATLVFPNREIVDRYYVPIIYTACRTCYSEQDPDEIFRRAVDGEFDPLKMQKLIGSVIESGHGSTIEHVVFTFAISGVSRTLSHQLVRHRAGVAFDQQSQRYVKFKGFPTPSRKAIPSCASVTRSRSTARSACMASCSGLACRARTPASCSRTPPGRTWS